MVHKKANYIPNVHACFDSPIIIPERFNLPFWVLLSNAKALHYTPVPECSMGITSAMICCQDSPRVSPDTMPEGVIEEGYGCWRDMDPEDTVTVARGIVKEHPCIGPRLCIYPVHLWCSCHIYPISAACRGWMQHLWGQTQVSSMAQKGGRSNWKGNLPTSTWTDPEHSKAEQDTDQSTAEGAARPCAAEDTEMNKSISEGTSALELWCLPSLSCT